MDYILNGIHQYFFMNGFTTIQIKNDDKSILDSLKVHAHQPYHEIIKELIKNARKK